MINIKINDFEGPFDLLLHLVESKKMNVRELQISKIIDDYLEIIKTYEYEDNFKIKVEFLQMASELLEIKAFSILRTSKKNVKEVDLEKRLMEYKLIKDISEEFSKNENEFFRAYTKKGGEDYTLEVIEHDYSMLTKDNLQACILAIFDRINKADANAIKLDFEEEYSVEEATDVIIHLEKNVPTNFSTLLKGKYSRSRIVSFFMAILEMYKANQIDIKIEDEEIFVIKE